MVQPEPAHVHHPLSRAAPTLAMLQAVIVTHFQFAARNQKRVVITVWSIFEAWDALQRGLWAPCILHRVSTIPSKFKNSLFSQWQHDPESTIVVAPPLKGTATGLPWLRCCDTPVWEPLSYSDVCQQNCWYQSEHPHVGLPIWDQEWDYDSTCASAVNPNPLLGFIQKQLMLVLRHWSILFSQTASVVPFFPPGWFTSWLPSSSMPCFLLL